MLLENDGERYRRQSRENAEMLNANLRRAEAQRQRDAKRARSDANWALLGSAVTGGAKLARWGMNRAAQQAASKPASQRAAAQDQPRSASVAPAAAESVSTAGAEQPTLFDYEGEGPAAAPASPEVSAEPAAGVNPLALIGLIVSLAFFLAPASSAAAITLGVLALRATRPGELSRKLALAAIAVGCFTGGLWALRTVVSAAASLLGAF